MTINAGPDPTVNTRHEKRVGKFSAAITPLQTGASVNELNVEADSISHAAAKLFPMIEGEEFATFLADIAARGQLQPIILDQHGMIVDGRNRWLAMKMLGREPIIEQRQLTHTQAIQLVISQNLRRRHQVQAGERAMILVKLEEMEAENFPTQAVAAEAAGISDHTFRDAKHLAKDAPEIAAEVAKGNISLHAGRRLAELPKGKDRDGALSKAKSNDKKATKHAIKAATGKYKATTIDSATLAIPGMTGEYAKLLHVVKVLADLPGVLGAMDSMTTERPLAQNHARQLRNAISQIRQMDFGKLVAAATLAIGVLDTLITEVEPDAPAAGSTSAAAA